MMLLLLLLQSQQADCATHADDLCMLLHPQTMQHGVGQQSTQCLVGILSQPQLRLTVDETPSPVARCLRI